MTHYTEEFRDAVTEIARLNGWTIPEAWEKCMRAKEIAVLPTDADAVAFMLASAEGRQALEATREKKFGFCVGQSVEIVSQNPGNPFNGQQTEVIGFLDAEVIVTVSGPPGEPDSEWPFTPSELRAL